MSDLAKLAILAAALLPPLSWAAAMQVSEEGFVAGILTLQMQKPLSWLVDFVPIVSLISLCQALAVAHRERELAEVATEEPRHCLD